MRLKNIDINDKNGTRKYLSINRWTYNGFRVAFMTENAGITDVSSISIFVSSIFISPFPDNQPPTPASVNRK